MWAGMGGVEGGGDIGGTERDAGGEMHLGDIGIENIHRAIDTIDIDPAG